MFTGIVEEMGTLKSIRKGPHSAVLEIQAKVVLEDIHLGDSIAVNGVCLTATSFSPTGFTADVMHETLNRSALAQLRPGSPVNLERAMAANGRFGGHIVAGHVDGMGTVRSVEKDDNAIWYTIAAGPEVLKYVVEKGSITIDGISLTVARVDDTSFAISAIPHTVAVTVLSQRRPGDLVNLETDIIGKYVEKLLHFPREAEKRPPASGITKEFLTRCGY
ncbi:MAG: riboflavin synthase [Clostridiales bacterium]|nr:riboflavin synthase [Clostridiales bacterium]MDY4172428.1 riboflavin synthase [Evtepia sp.]